MRTKFKRKLRLVRAADGPQPQGPVPCKDCHGSGSIGNKGHFVICPFCRGRGTEGGK